SDAVTVLANKDSFLKPYGENGLMGFVELLRPPVSLILVGAGNDALPIVDMASILGWQTTIVDGRATHANTQRFSKASRIIVAKPAEAMEQIPVDEQTVFVLMTHNYNYDLDILRLLLKKDCRYIGTLGPRKRLERMLAELKEQGIEVTDEQRTKIYGPTGLDIGAEAAEEIALSLLAEIKAVLTARQGTFLRDRVEGIHARSTSAMSEQKT
ncbi:MAG TPA: XdhC family protein, partial [Flavisolibacter sp.]|nr:XdhC family protein [Flavisolibacter sp.]